MPTPDMGDGSARKVQGPPRGSPNDLYHRRIRQTFQRAQRGGACTDLPPVLSNEVDCAADMPTFYEGFVPLHIHDHLEVPVTRHVRNLRDAIGSRGVLRCGQFDRGAQSPAYIGHLNGVGGNQRMVKHRKAPNPAPYPLDQGLPEKWVKRLPGESGGREPGRNDPENLTAHAATGSANTWGGEDPFTLFKLPKVQQ